ncbi:uncharacterized protein UBRO_08968 [Ustilago bromivora]|uniref:Nucleoporin NDC1 n=1 Tax=Ustilago bromivora TaxID=307758 RepID=A0A1K0GEG2_9BASI|nr:uncharacterized protein UBRO_08968 [Ustilago bromivora]SYW77457.1 uncharacterized protein UBRO2_01837 [Ustilago bromivora]
MPSGLAAIPQAQLSSKYRDLVKIALKPRQTRAFVLAAIAWHLFLTSALLKTISLSILLPSTLLVSLASFGLGVLPLLAARKRNLSRITWPPPRLAPTKAQQISTALSNAALLATISNHVVAFIVLALGYAALLTSQSGGWGPQIWVESHASFYLNERFLYLVAQTAVLATVYAVLFRSLPSPETAASSTFDAAALSCDANVTIKDRVVVAFGSRLPKAVAVAALTSTSSVLVYSMIRIRVWSTVLLVIGTRGLLRRVLVPSFRVDFDLFQVTMRSTLFSIAAVCAVETAYLLLDVYLSHPLAPVSKYAKDPNRLLLDGIDEPIILFANHAFVETARLSAGDKEMRALIYKDVNSDVTAWAHIRDRCLTLLEVNKQFVVCRGQTAPAAQTAAKPAAQQVAQAQQQNTSGQPTGTIWDQLAAGQTAAAAASSKEGAKPTQAAGAASASAKKPTANTTASALVSIRSISKAATSVITTAWKLVPTDAKHVLFGPRRQQSLLGESPACEAASIVGRDAIRVVGAVVSLKELLCHSLEEDPYGSVQKDIKRVLIAMVDLAREIRCFGLQLEQRACHIDDKLSQLEAEANQSTSTAKDKPQQSTQKPEGEGQGRKSRMEAQQELREAWKTSGAQSIDFSLTAAIREILDTFARFDLHLGAELEVKLADCLR